MLRYDDRFKDAPWYTNSKNDSIIIVGAGGIGSNLVYCLGKSTLSPIYIIDPDKVEAANVGCQFFDLNQVGDTKVSAVYETMKKHNIHISTITSRYSGENIPIIVSAVDNMKTRKQVFDVWKKRLGKELLLDGRLRANYYEVYAVVPGKEEEYEKTLFSDSEVDEGPCTFKQTAYFGMLIGARMTQIVINYLTNKYAEEPLCNVPFKVSEFGEPFSFEIS
jgi:molybdopterin/thiamine biosynthesis adenylyltransferase